MHPSTGRPNRRSSRMSTPLTRSHSPAPAPPEQKKEKPKTFLDRWVEPPLKNPTPSFEEHGFQRGGVLQEMAPLGAMPGARLRAKIRDSQHRNQRLSRNGLVVGTEDSTVTPELSPSDPTSRGASHKPDESLPLLEPTQQRDRHDEDEDEDYIPVGTKMVMRPGKSSPGKTTPFGHGHGRSSSAHQLPKAHSSNSEPQKKARPSKSMRIVDAALNRANQPGNDFVSGLALRSVFHARMDEDPHLLSLLRAIVSRNPTDAQLGEFKKYIRAAKKRIRALDAAAPDQNHITPEDTATQAGTPEASATKSFTTTTISDNDPAGRTRSSSKITLKLSPPSASNSRPSKRRRTSSPDRFTAPSKSPTVNGAVTHTNGTSLMDRSASASRKSSISSSSDLSSIDEAITIGAAATDNGAGSPTQAVSGKKRFPKLDLKTSKLLSSKPREANRKRSGTDAMVNGENDAELTARREMLSQDFSEVAVGESFERTSRMTPKRNVPNGDRLTSLKRQADEELGEPGPARAASRASTRQGTPTSVGRESKRQKPNSARTKTSPLKQKTGVVAGVAPRSGGARPNPLGSEDEMSDNDDYCAACGGGGYLLCCDGCDRAFHFACLDPPMSKRDAALDEPWYCHVCKAQAESPRKQEIRMFAGLFNGLAQSNPSSFTLPAFIRNFFEDVNGSGEGEYEEVHAQKIQTRRRTGWEEQPDYKQLKDAKGHVNLCSQCGKSALGAKQIIPCSVCEARWHLDCLDPPMANPPPHRHDKENFWMCPRHVEHDLRALEPSMQSATQSRAHRIRKPKNMIVRPTQLSRGFKNNGLIEIESEPKSSEHDDVEMDSDEEDGVVPRVPERGIKLDFIAKVKQVKAQAAAARIQSSARSIPPTCLVDDFAGRAFKDQKAALNLAQLAQKQPDLNLESDTVQNLINALTAESPDSVVDGMTASEANKATDTLERAQLLALQELIHRRLNGTAAAA